MQIDFIDWVDDDDNDNSDFLVIIIGFCVAKTFKYYRNYRRIEHRE